MLINLYIKGIDGGYMDFASFKYNIVKLIKMPPQKLIRKAGSRITDNINEYIDKKRDTHVKSSFKCLYSNINPKMLDVTMIDLKTASFLLDMDLGHYFDLLGSGFVKVNYNLKPYGVDGFKYDQIKIDKFDREGKWLSNIILKPHLGYSQKIWRKIGEEYEPINWELDFKSGFCYSSKAWYKKQPVGRYRGADIKVPWELSRMQHLPELAVFSLIFPEKKDAIINEFKNEILDFCMTNPVNMGVNWACTMDAAIRVSNMLIAYDILHGIDSSNILNDEFTSFFSNFIYEHGNFIIHNLEWENGKYSNHYLSDICGLLFVSAYLERNETTDAWLAFSIQELIFCIENQFNCDGTNFEGSTSYHRLSGELIIYSTALVYGLLKTDKRNAIKEYNCKLVKRLLPYSRQKFDIESENFFPVECLEKIFLSGLFTKDITKPNGNITQVGDNDSGRFFKFSPVGEFKSCNELADKYKNLIEYKGIDGIDKYFDENIINHSTFISAVDGLFDFEGFKSFSSAYPLEKSIIKALSDNFHIEITGSNSINNTLKQLNNYCLNMTEPNIKHKTIIIPNRNNMIFSKKIVISFSDYTDSEINVNKINLFVYPEFGLYIFKTYEFYLSVFAGNINKLASKAHVHNDKLSFELNISGKDIYFDPGTYLYTPVPEMRDKFRSTIVHNTVVPVDGCEQNRFISLSSISNETTCNILDLKITSLEAELIYRDVCIRRKFTIKNDCLEISDSSNKDFISNFNNTIYSAGYGKLINEHWLK